MLFTSKRRLHLLDFRSVEHILMQKKLKIIENHRNTISQKQHSSKKVNFPYFYVAKTFLRRFYSVVLSKYFRANRRGPCSTQGHLEI